MPIFADGETKSLYLKVKDPFYIRSLLSKSKTLDDPNYNVVVKHTMQVTKLLRNLGIEAPAPITSQYRWPGKYQPFDHQLVMADFLTVHRRAFNLSEMGVGKSAAALWAADYLMLTKRVRKVLVITPLSTLERVWKQDIFDVLMHRTVSIVHGPVAKRVEAIEADVDFYLLNHDGVKIKQVSDALQRKPEIDLVIIDEASMFRNASTEKYKALKRMLRADQRLWLLTGTPCPSAPTDAWALAKLIEEKRVPKFFGAFKRLTMEQVSQFKWVPKPDAFNIAYDAMQPAIRFKKADCLDLPPVVTTDRQTKLTKDQIKAFKAMMTTMRMEAKSSPITAVNAADKITKLRQVLCGVVKDPETEKYIEIDHSLRTETLIETIHEAEAKVIVIVPFKGIIRTLEKKLRKGWSVAVLNGDVSPKVRNKIIEDFKYTSDPHILLCHPKVMAHGLNLTEADMLVFYAPIYSNDEYQQVVERFNRTGQTRSMTVVRIGAHPLEWRIYQAVDTKSAAQDNILKLYNAVLAGENM